MNFLMAYMIGNHLDLDIYKQTEKKIQAAQLDNVRRDWQQFVQKIKLHSITAKLQKTFRSSEALCLEWMSCRDQPLQSVTAPGHSKGRDWDPSGDDNHASSADKKIVRILDFGTLSKILWAMTAV